MILISFKWGLTAIYELFLDEAYRKGIKVYENIKFESNSKGLIKGNKIALNSSLKTNKERTCILVEELAHCEVNVGNIVDQRNVDNRKQEYKARKLAYDRLVGLKGIINAYDKGCVNIYEMAEYLNVTEEFLLDAIKCYKNIYGVYTMIDNYIIYFDPSLHVGKLY